jgi:hypothetical protein
LIGYFRSRYAINQDVRLEHQTEFGCRVRAALLKLVFESAQTEASVRLRMNPRKDLTQFFAITSAHAVLPRTPA